MMRKRQKLSEKTKVIHIEIGYQLVYGLRTNEDCNVFRKEENRSFEFFKHVELQVRNICEN